jgi:putative endonuclease
MFMFFKVKLIITFIPVIQKNIELRFNQHQTGQIESTKNRRPLKLIYFEACLNQQDAIHREKYLKTHYGKMFLRNRLKSYLTG